MNRTWMLVLALTCGMLAASPRGYAEDIPIVNAGFEQRQLAEDGGFDGAGYDYVLDGEGWGWSGTDEENGIWNPTTEYPDTPNGAPEGNMIGYVYAETPVVGGFAQILSTPLAANTEYTLTVEVGNTGWYSGFPGYRVELAAGGVQGPAVDGYPGEVTGGVALATDENLTPPDEDTFVTVTLPYTSPADGPLLGEPLQIRLFRLDGAEGLEVEFDDVRLTSLVTHVVIPGDANDNGFVDDIDLAIVLGNWEQDPEVISTWGLGNFTEESLGDTDVEDADLAVLLGNWTGSPPPAGAAVPEPASIALLTLGALTLARRRRQ